MCEALREFFRPELEEATEKGIKLGMQQGMQQGVQQTTQDVIERMLRKGKTPNEIHDLLDYPLVEIEEVLNQMLTATE